MRQVPPCFQVQAALIGSLEKVVSHLSKAFVLDDIIPTLADERLNYSADCVSPLIGKSQLVSFTLGRNKASALYPTPSHVSQIFTGTF